MAGPVAVQRDRDRVVQISTVEPTFTGVQKSGADEGGMTQILSTEYANGGRLVQQGYRFDTVDFTNSSSVPHNMTIEDSSGKQVGATATFSGGSKSFTVDLKPGKYTFFCSVPGHREAGMQGTLTVS